MPSSRGSSRPRDGTQASPIVGGLSSIDPPGILTPGSSPDVGSTPGENGIRSPGSDEKEAHPQRDPCCVAWGHLPPSALQGPPSSSRPSCGS